MAPPDMMAALPLRTESCVESAVLTQRRNKEQGHCPGPCRCQRGTLGSHTLSLPLPCATTTVNSALLIPESPCMAHSVYSMGHCLLASSQLEKQGDHSPTLEKSIVAAPLEGTLGWLLVCVKWFLMSGQHFPVSEGLILAHTCPVHLRAPEMDSSDTRSL
ncbi:uncharacterized protein [Symphalangus syndactylus]|uniref:uncharacterized protein isoform X2 n=1 Tax=Symphalangus syndactylus TaxID=9590 RepID=UPI003007CFFD